MTISLLRGWLNVARAQYALWSPFKESLTVPVTMEQIERFAALVAKHEREECAKVCDERERANLYGLKECAALIRERGVK